ncbi:MAG: hypothetical protein HC889_09060, partial [Synechococcaceae cyanobacterium SM1_2_3]|nr:hypothetical protein [Synechococcaceae cyanobacterium SM1_2_3]
MKSKNPTRTASLLSLFMGWALSLHAASSLRVDTLEQWNSATARSEGIKFQEGYAETDGNAGYFRSKVFPVKTKKKLSRIVFEQ